MFKTIKENTSAEIIEKKSKFIANIFYIESKEEAEEIIKEYEKKYHDARHNCYAYRIFLESGIIEKFSDAGEPSGTAGSPMLNILIKNELANILVIVTRYFGGILLGTGGLVRAYSKVTILALESAEILQKDIVCLYQIELDYTDLDKFKYYCKNNNINIQEQTYGINVILKIAVKKTEDIQKLQENFNLKIKKYLMKTYI